MRITNSGRMSRLWMIYQNLIHWQVSLTKESLRMVSNLLKLSLLHFASFLILYNLCSLIKPQSMACPINSSLQVITSRLIWKRSAYIKPLVQMINASVPQGTTLAPINILLNHDQRPRLQSSNI